MCEHIDGPLKYHKLIGVHPFEPRGVYVCKDCGDIIQYLGASATLVPEEVKQSFVTTSDK